MKMKAKKSRDKQKRRKVFYYEERRNALKLVLVDPSLTEEGRLNVLEKLRKLPRDSSPTRVRNRCVVTGRARSVYRAFRVSRVELRRKGSGGQIPGLRKASW